MKEVESDPPEEQVSGGEYKQAVRDRLEMLLAQAENLHRHIDVLKYTLLQISMVEQDPEREVIYYRKGDAYTYKIQVKKRNPLGFWPPRT